MKFSKILSVVLGFGTIGLLSSVLAKIQGYVFPGSLELFDNSIAGSHDITQYVIKLFCVYISCFMGGVVCASLKGGQQEILIIAGCITIVIGWLWLSVGQPIWFWTFLVSGVFPFSVFGSRNNIIRR
ncbi:hypothetical protein [Dyadobacter sp. Leaf189]|uniref:hypothetical protein n=1 Tax=Dyadobacter sp. Leaf189 TaxID=1736295 RepID=UPI0006FDB26A|nr:hypothetical protein [Dyadobacter sp. Leaf189]KQS27915.1 hypothetical protein ASG33_16015 [Dyadobacter sp. Leaf189]